MRHVIRALLPLFALLLLGTTGSAELAIPPALEEAVRSYEADDHAKAWELAEAVLAGEPDERTADLARRVRYAAGSEVCGDHLRARDFDAALACYEKLRAAIGDGEGADRILYNVAAAAMKAGKPAAASKAYGELIEQFPDSEIAPHAFEGAATIATRLGRFRQAAGLLERFAHLFPRAEGAGSSLRRSGTLWRAFGEPERAMAAWRHFARLFPKDSAAIVATHAIGAVLEDEQRWADVIAHYEAFEKRFGRQAPRGLLYVARLRRARAHGALSGTGHERAAKKILTALADAELRTGERRSWAPRDQIPDSVARARLMLARARAKRLGDELDGGCRTRSVDELARSLGEIVVAYGRVFELHVVRWSMEAVAGEGVAYLDVAGELGEKACDGGAGDPAAAAGLRDKGIATLREVLAVAAESGEWSVALEAAADRSGHLDPRHAAPPGEYAVPTRLLPPVFDSPGTAELLGRVWDALHRREADEALALLRQIPGEGAFGIPARVSLAAAHYVKGEEAIASLLCEDVTTEAPDEPAVWNLLAILRFHEGRYGTARKLLDGVVERAPGAAAAWVNRAALRFRVRDYAGARDDLRKARELAPEDDAIRRAESIASERAGGS